MAQEFLSAASVDSGSPVRKSFAVGFVAISTSVQLLCCFKRTVWHMVETGNAVLRAAWATACLLPWSRPRWRDGPKAGKKQIHVCCKISGTAESCAY